MTNSIQGAKIPHMSRFTLSGGGIRVRVRVRVRVREKKDQKKIKGTNNKAFDDNPGHHSKRRVTQREDH